MVSGVVVSRPAPVVQAEEPAPAPVQPRAEEPQQTVAADEPELPVGFWTDLCTDVRKELKPPALGFFTPNGPIRHKLQGDTLVLTCDADFTAQVINKADVLEVIARKASAKLGRLIFVKVLDSKSAVNNSQQMEQLLRFGRDHSGIINIK